MKNTDLNEEPENVTILSENEDELPFHKDDSGVYWCDLCPKSFDKFSSLRSHVLRMKKKPHKDTPYCNVWLVENPDGSISVGVKGKPETEHPPRRVKDKGKDYGYRDTSRREDTPQSPIQDLVDEIPNIRDAVELSRWKRRLQLENPELANLMYPEEGQRKSDISEKLVNLEAFRLLRQMRKEEEYNGQPQEGVVMMEDAEKERLVEELKELRGKLETEKEKRHQAQIDGLRNEFDAKLAQKGDWWEKSMGELKEPIHRVGNMLESLVKGAVNAEFPQQPPQRKKPIRKVGEKTILEMLPSDMVEESE
ncbi:MAG: hypothetical protein OEZ25_07200 [Candidatus Bathyarchaeota archaeon]|nr:hypothetical protein [Candidatus Bathyarchaeota archaeon]